MSDDSTDQFRFNAEGDLEEPDDDEDEEQTNDFGEEMPWYETKGGFRRDVMSSLFQKACRRSDDETAAFAAWELVRSGEGYETTYWNRAVLVCLEDLVAGNEAIEHVLRYEDLAKNRYADNDWARRLCAIAAAMVCARARSGRETTHANGYFSNTMVDQARAQQDADHEPLYEPPVTEEELEADGKYGFISKDKHTYPGAGMGRDWAHFRIHGARCSDETDLGRTWWRRVLRYDAPEYAYREPEESFSEEEIEHAVSPVDDDDPWGCEFDEDTDLDEFDSEEG